MQTQTRQQTIEGDAAYIGFMMDSLCENSRYERDLKKIEGVKIISRDEAEKRELIVYRR